MKSSYIAKLISGHSDFIKKADLAERYFKNQNDICDKGTTSKKDSAITDDNPLKFADNRISHNWHSLLVNQKAGYLFTYPPLIDCGDKKINELVTKTLGNKFPKVMKDLAIQASNSVVGWLHYWFDDEFKSFKYAVVDSRQIVPVFSGKLENGIIGVLRAYPYVDEKGDTKTRCEYWDKEKVRFYEQNTDNNYVPFYFPDVGEEMEHNYGAVPFIPFYNNSMGVSDLDMYKDLIDAYDKVYSGFSNDIEDVQEVIFVLENYGGVDKKEFLSDLKENKMITVEDDGGVSTIKAEIPYQARGEFLEITRKQIFKSGMGVDPDIEKIGQTSGEALKFIYSLLELKSGLMETEFRTGLEELVRAICRLNNVAEPENIIQTWTRNAVKNDTETSQIASQSKDVVSERTILKNHPWVDNVEEEIEQLEKERAKADERKKQSFGIVDNTPPEEVSDEDEE